MMTGDDHSKEIDEKDFDDAKTLTDSRRIFARRPKRALNLVNDLISRRGLAAEKSDAKLQGVWDGVVGMNIANQTRVASLRRGVLVVDVSNSSLMQMLEFKRQDYIQEINEQLQSSIKDLRFRIGSIN